MVEIRPFNGLMFDKGVIKDFGLVITPPYDVINDTEKREYMGLSKYNIVNLILGGNYSGTARLFNEWINKGVIKNDGKESIYVYSQSFDHNGKTFERIGFISLVKLEELGNGILPHEKILEKPFKDRLALINAAKANFGSVFMLYDDRAKLIDAILKSQVSDKGADVFFEDKYGIKHSLWKVCDTLFIHKLRKEMLNYQCIIADGHHRYRSVLEFKKNNPDLIDARYTMCCFINSFNDGLFVLPIDRFVFGLKNLDINKILAKLRDYFDVEEVSDVNSLIEKVDNTTVMLDKAQNLKNHVFGMYCYLNRMSYFLKLKKNNILDEHYYDKTDIYRKLDINLLHKIVFEGVLEISEEEQYKGTHIEYTKGPKRALEKIKEDRYQFAFFLNAPLMREIFLTARSGETMPQKSTYFYPKVYSGLVINKIGE